MTWSSEVRAFLEAVRVGHLATINADRSPHVVPVCYAFDGALFFSVIDQKPKRVAPRSLRRVRNISQRPLVSLVVDRYAEDWSRLGFVLVSGTAHMLWEGEQYRRALALLREKYPQSRAMDLEDRPVICIIATRVTVWGRLIPSPLAGEG